VEPNLCRFLTLTGSTLKNLCACLMPGPKFPSAYVIVYFCAHFVVIGGLVEHHCLNILCIILENLTAS